MMNKLLTKLILALALLDLACFPPQLRFEFEPEYMFIESCESRPIFRIELRNRAANESSSLSYGTAGVTRVYLLKDTLGFDRIFTDKMIMPNAEYNLVISAGSATTGYIILFTDSLGIIDSVINFTPCKPNIEPEIIIPKNRGRKKF